MTDASRPSRDRRCPTHAMGTPSARIRSSQNSPRVSDSTRGFAPLASSDLHHVKQLSLGAALPERAGNETDLQSVDVTHWDEARPRLPSASGQSCPAIVRANTAARSREPHADIAR